MEQTETLLKFGLLRSKDTKSTKMNKILYKTYIFNSDGKCVEKVDWRPFYSDPIERQLLEVTLEQLRHGIFAKMDRQVKFATSETFEKQFIRNRFKIN